MNCWLDIISPLWHLLYYKNSRVRKKECLHLLHKKAATKAYKIYHRISHISTIHMQNDAFCRQSKEIETFFTFIKIDRKDVFLKDDVLQHYSDIIITTFVMRNFRYYIVFKDWQLLYHYLTLHDTKVFVK